MKILVADDEMVSRGKLQHIMSRFGRCKAVAGGKKAMAEFERGWNDEDPYDLMMLDISMPDLSGPEVLARIRSFERTGKVPRANQIAVVMVTSHADRNHILSCLQRGCNDYIVKPFTLETIREKIARLKVSGTSPDGGETRTGEGIDAEALVQEITARFERNEIALPTSPRLTMDFRRMILDGAEFSKIADLLRQDAAVSAELIRVANSALYRGLEVSQTVEQAIARLGTGITEQIVASICHRALFVQKKRSYAALLERLWRHSLATGHACDIIAAEAVPDIQSEAFTMGLLHDVGWLLLIQILSELEKNKRFRTDMTQEARIALLEKHHGEFGARIFEKWGFSPKYQRISRLHHNPYQDGKAGPDLLAVHLANRVAIEAGFDLKETADTLALEESDAVRDLNLSRERLAAVSARLKERMNSLEGLLM